MAASLYPAYKAILAGSAISVAPSGARCSARGAGALSLNFTAATGENPLSVIRKYREYSQFPLPAAPRCKFTFTVLGLEPFYASEIHHAAR